MRWLESDKLTKRAIVAFVITVVVLAGLAMIGYFGGRWEAPP